MNLSYSCSLYVGPLLQAQKLWGGLHHFSVRPRPLGFGFGTKGLVVQGQGLTKMQTPPKKMVKKIQITL